MECPKCTGTRIVGIEVRGVYDGVLYWVCETCNTAFPRNWEGYGRRKDICEEHVARHNANRRR
jgi:hypothetical protein